MLQAHFSRFFAANPGWLHFAAHSHHPWPDATEAAQRQAWVDGATLADRKWTRVMGEVLPAAQRHVARLAGLSDSGQVAFAPNTHEFVLRLLSCLPSGRPARVLASAHEFHSFRRQVRRLAEDGLVELEEVPGSPWGDFEARFAARVAASAPDLVFVSQVFFDSGFVVRDLARIVAAAPPEALVAIDGYHTFCALPVDLSSIHRRAFWMAGGYKYAMSGEGCCFLAIPPGCDLRPRDTGWYAAFDRLAAAAGDRTGYAEGAHRFWGATFDPSGLYRFVAAMDWLVATGVAIGDIHAHSHAMQSRFLEGLGGLGLEGLRPDDRVLPEGVPRGNFLAFEREDAQDLHAKLLAAGIYVDRRDRRIRFGFGAYHDEAMVDRLLETLARTLR
jgi:kynureninase